MFPHSAGAQPIGSWHSLLPYNIAVGIATDGQTLYTITEQAFFSYDAVNGETETFSKVQGMHDVNMSAVGWDAATGTVILAYRNSNIDLYRNHSFTNIPDIKLRSFTGSKAINHIYTENGTAYLSTGLGIVVLNLSKPEVKETYIFSKGGQTLVINGFTSDGTYFYAATSQGLYRASRNNPVLQAFSSWQAIDSINAFEGVVTAGGKVFATNTDSLFYVNGLTLQTIFSTGGATVHLDGGDTTVYVSTFHPIEGYAAIKRISSGTLQLIDSLLAGNPRGVAEAGGAPWEADAYGGLTSYDKAGRQQQHVPDAPANYYMFDALARGKDVWLAHGGYQESFSAYNNPKLLSHYVNGSWTLYTSQSISLFADSVTDVLSLVKDPADGTLYAGTLASGLLAIHTDGSPQVIKQGILEPSLLSHVYSASSLAYDQGGNLWVTNSGAQDQLAVRTPAGVWYHYSTPYSGAAGRLAQGLIVDDANQKWYYIPASGGVVVYNDNSTPENGADDRYTVYLSGTGAGNLPNNNVFCLAKDREGAIWVGTSDGIGIISCATDALSGTCDAEKRIVQYDQFAGYLFAGESVHTIAVDGANRKWIGTNNGIWLISADGDKQILRFTADNSPLPSNNISKISIDPITGEVYIGTDAGTIGYGGTATQGGESNEKPLTVYPNPVASDYSGTIAIRGLVADADVRITDIAGQLIYRTKALGGQAIWSGLDYTGHRPQTGVLLIFASSKDGSQTATGKIIYQH